MNADDILKIIRAIPEYIVYVYPGYLTVYIYFFLRGKTLKDNNYIFLKAIAISYIHIAIIDWLKDIVDMSFLPVSQLLRENIFLILLAGIFAYIGYMITISKSVQKVLRCLNIRTTFHENEIEVLADFNKGAWLCIYLKDDDVVYEGSLGYKELEDEKRQYICLNAYYKYFLDNDGKPREPYAEDHEGNYNETVLIFYDSIKRIEKRDTSEKESSE